MYVERQLAALSSASAARDSEKVEGIIRSLLVSYIDEACPFNILFFYACKHNIVELLPDLLKKVDVNKQHSLGCVGNRTYTTAFYATCKAGHLETTKLLLQDSRLEVNQKDLLRRSTPFFAACHAQQTALVEILLQDSRIDINATDLTERTPLLTACQTNNTKIAQLLLQDPRVKVQKIDANQKTAFFYACQHTHPAIITLLLTYAFRKNPVLLRKPFSATLVTQLVKILDSTCTAEIKENNLCLKFPMHADAISFSLEDFKKFCTLAIKDAKQQLIEAAAELFCLIVYVCDGYLRLLPTLPLEKQRFLGMVQKLPLELQMFICCRAFGLAQIIIGANLVEQGLKKIINKSPALAATSELLTICYSPLLSAVTNRHDTQKNNLHSSSSFRLDPHAEPFIPYQKRSGL